MPTSSVSAADASYVRNLVRKKSAISLDESKLYLIETRLAELARRSGHESVGDLLQQSRRGTADVETSIVEALCTHETSFFRDSHPFDVLRQKVLPELIRARRLTRSLTIWSAACSSGQEPYSLGMMLRESFPELNDWMVRIIATDLSESVLAKAREGKFTQLEVNRGLPTPLLLKYFDRVGAGFQIKEELRRIVDFRKVNLLGDWGVLRPDIVFMRNVLIYFETPVKQGILGRLRQTLAPDGCLFLGAAESTMGVDEAWHRVCHERTAYFRVRP
jgi:chemotaxis protein methyltransferase CheR